MCHLNQGKTFPNSLCTEKLISIFAQTANPKEYHIIISQRGYFIGFSGNFKILVSYVFPLTVSNSIW